MTHLEQSEVVEDVQDGSLLKRARCAAQDTAVFVQRQSTTSPN